MRTILGNARWITALETGSNLYGGIGASLKH